MKQRRPSGEAPAPGWSYRLNGVSLPEKSQSGWNKIREGLTTYGRRGSEVNRVRPRIGPRESVVLARSHDGEALCLFHVADKDVLVLSAVAVLSPDIGLNARLHLRHDEV